MKPVLTLIDASNFIFRAYHAIQHLSTSKGVATNAVYGFTRMVLKTLRELEPTHIALAFDKESRTGRQAIDPSYKATREGPPADLIPQFELIRKIVEVLNLPVLEYAGWEADDVIGTMVQKARAEGFGVRVVTGDKDFVQIVADDVELFDPMQDRWTRVPDVKERLGITADQMTDYLALIGDAIDNVAKVPGIGPKTAVELLAQFGHVEPLLERLDQVKKPKIREALASHREQLLRAKQLVTFKCDLPLDVTLADLARRQIHDGPARALFGELEFFKLLQEMPALPPTPLPEKTEVVVTRAAAEALAEAIRQGGELTAYPAYDGLAHSAQLVGLGVALADGRTYYVPVGHRSILSGPQLAERDFVEVLGPLFEDPQIRKLGHDLKAFTLLVTPYGITLRGVYGDVEMLSYLLNPSRKEHALQDLARERLRLELPTRPAAALGKKGTAVADLTVDELALCYGSCAEGARRLVKELWPELENVGLAKLAREIELPLLPVLARMERAGIKVDIPFLQRLAGSLEGQIGTLEADIHRMAGKPFHVASNAQLAEVLYTDLKLPVLKRGKTGPSTDQEVLEKLAEQHPMPKAILEFRQLCKLKSTYLDTLPELVAKDGRIHTTFNQAAAATGRLSSTDPNLQNIPIRTELGREIRKAFIAEPGNRLVSADYSQVELRILAHYAEDPALIEAFTHDEDIHRRTAAEVFGVKPEEVTFEQRSASKMVNFGIAYGLSPHGLSTRLNIPIEEAASIIERYFARYAGIKRYLDETLEKARRTGYVETLFGRRRYMPELQSRNRAVVMAAERAAINMPIQGTAADLIKMAMIQLDEALTTRKLKTRMLLQVHDELVFEAPEAEVEEISALAKQRMSGVATLKVPLRIDVGAGQSWEEAH